MIHKKILAEAKANPDAAIGDLADEVSGASASFVKRVLDEYGDPATSSGRIRRADGAGSAYNQMGETDLDDPNSSAVSDEESTPRTDSPPGSGEDVALSELSRKQHETLRAIHERPTAIQEEIAAELDVSRATVSKRVNGIPGFDWEHRQRFVTEHFDESVRASTEQSPTEATDQAERIEELTARLDRVEDELESITRADGGGIDDPELLQKVGHACLDAEYLSTDEELRILRTVLPVDASD
jgi:hypothetical protein